MRAVITAREIGTPIPRIPLRLANLPEFEGYLQPVIAAEKVRYVGEPIAVVVADSRALAEDALAGIVADIENLPPVPDRHAAEAAQSLLFEGRSNRAVRYEVAVGDVDFPVVALHDRPGDGEAEARMTAEALRLRPDRMEAVENGLPQLGGNARSLVVNPDADLVADMRRGYFDQPPRRRETDRVVDDVVDRTGKPACLTHDDGAGPPRPCEGKPDIAGLAPRFPGRDDLLDQLAEIDRLEPRASQLRIGSRCFANVADQPVEPDDILPDYVDQLFAKRRILDPFADKLIICGTFIYLAAIPASGITPWMAVVVMGREMLVTGLRSFLEQRGKDFSAAWSGKIKMVLQCVAAGMSLFYLAWRPEWLWQPLIVAVWLAVASTVYSGIGYIQRAIRLFQQ